MINQGLFSSKLFRGKLSILGLMLLTLCCWMAKAEVIISESHQPSGYNKEQVFFECNTVYCEGNKKTRYFWVYDEIAKFHRKYSDLGKLSLYSKMSVILGSFRRIFNEKAILAFYVVKQLKDREILEIGPFQSDEMPQAFIEKGEGSLGKTLATGEKTILYDVKQDENYLPMHSTTKGEIVWPIKQNGKLVAAFILCTRDENGIEKIDEFGLMKILEWIDRM